MGKLFTQSDGFDVLFEVAAEKLRQMQNQLASFIWLTADHRTDGIECVKQKMRIDLRLQEFDFRSREQDLFLLIFAIQNLAG
ncbi:Uncharacterised protein [Vibrio cholerae]|nr:Uncharacterised protein [Vibrio cholerae]